MRKAESSAASPKSNLSTREKRRDEHANLLLTKCVAENETWLFLEVHDQLHSRDGSRFAISTVNNLFINYTTSAYDVATLTSWTLHILSPKIIQPYVLSCLKD